VTAPTTTQLRKTALHAVHRRLGAKMVDFGGWDMPVEYSGIIREHLATRTAAGLFDVSHMGELEVRGPHALELVQHVTSNNAAALVDGQAQYSGLLTSAGTFVDDLLVHRISESHYLLCVNASNQDKDFDYIREHNRFGAELENAGPRYSQLALQGPLALGILERLTQAPIASLRYYHFMFGEVDGVACLIARTGYTAKTDSSCTFRPSTPKSYGMTCWTQGAARGCCPAGWVRGTRCAWRLRCAFTGMRSTTPPPSGKRGSGGSAR
jgi:aminomethyltransferase